MAREWSACHGSTVPSRFRALGYLRGAAASFVVAVIVAQQGAAPPSPSTPSAPQAAAYVSVLQAGPVAQEIGPSVRPLVEQRVERAAPKPALLVDVPRGLPVRLRAGSGPTIGWMPVASKYYRVPLTAWVLAVSANGRYGRVTLPYSGTGRTGWISLRSLDRHRTPYAVHIDLSKHLLTVTRLGKVVYRTSGATGAPGSRTPTGRFFVTDRIPFARGSTYGSFAFGISGIQTHLPAGWHGGNQLAIHGTNAPWTIGTDASAGCVRVSETALEKLKPWLRLGTPVVIGA